MSRIHMMKHKSTHKHAKSSGRRSGARAYTSPLRAEQAALTRQRIVKAYGDEVTRSDDAELTVQGVAARAGVSVPTLYRNFPSLDALGEAFWAWVEPQMGSFAKLEGPDDLAAFANGLFIQFGKHEPLVRAMFVMRSGR